MLKETLGALIAFQKLQKEKWSSLPVKFYSIFFLFCLYSEQVRVASVQQSKIIGQRNLKPWRTQYKITFALHYMSLNRHNELIRLSTQLAEDTCNTLQTEH